MNNYKHLSLTERCIIEQCLITGYSIKEISDKISRHVSTVSREILRHRTFIRSTDTKCANYSRCVARSVCGNHHCSFECRNCTSFECSDVCPDFCNRICPGLNIPPYVCVNCDLQASCGYEKAFYHAQNAHSDYCKVNSESQKGARLSEEQLETINSIASPLIKKGQSPAHIFSTHSEELGISRRSLYNYIDEGLLDVINLDLPRKVRYKKRKVKRTQAPDQKYRMGRSIDDFNAFMEEHPDYGIVEMDTVKGKREKGKTLLTMIFNDYDFMLVFLLDANTQECVEEVFDYLWRVLGIDIFRRLFPVILTDNGSEFKNPYALENSKQGLFRTRIFYCDPMASWQKPHIERGHEYIRMVLPKGTSFDCFDQSDITKLTNHIKSYYRDTLGSRTPYQAAKAFLGPKVTRMLDLKKIPPDEVHLKPTLLR